MANRARVANTRHTAIHDEHRAHAAPTARGHRHDTRCCDTLECVERPSFFCGQLLTDKDLDASVQYVIDKNKLHNRYLFGSGVVCGLLVHCDPCDPMSVIVKPGLALDCYGNDLLVCEPTPFDLKEALKCRRRAEEDCEGKPRTERCKDGESEYCITVSYAEEPTKPVSALVRDAGCRVSRCEPSRMRETVRFDLIEEKDRLPAAGDPSFWAEIVNCVAAEAKKIDAIADRFARAAALHEDRQTAYVKIYSDMKAAIFEFADSRPQSRCDIDDLICELDRHVRQGQQAEAAMVRLFLLWLQLVVDCFCNAILVPCMECCEPEHLVLACVTIKDGKVTRICNSVRRQVITGPALRYWLQPLFNGYHAALDYICCRLDLWELIEKYVGSWARHEMAPMAAFSGAGMYVKSAFGLGKESLKEAKGQLSESVTPFMLVNRPWREVQAELKEKAVTYEEPEPGTVEEVFSVKHLPETPWLIRPGDRVRVLLTEDLRVGAILKSKGRP